ncbi:type II toxin-antitoxin system HicB family antitoxin [Novosphingobium rosa]|uniref:type II toxin-antitoxin system HicB family antitoxin n=1 Tax=Novosphingobium rosa TaxID=76978 RepID=UPI00082EF9B8|nr:type II toxin-antitoxin system HicB family antitoxin [Novosphingobium rosa]
MKTYIALVHKEEDSSYGISWPDLPGCFSAADTEDELLPMATEALTLWFEDAQEVTPRSLKEVLAVVADDLAEGAFLLAVPRLSVSTRSVRVNLSLDSGTLADIDAAAAQRKLTRSAFIAEATRNEIRGMH